MMNTCPICKRTYTEPPALSRKDNKTAICPSCGMREALEDAGMIVRPEPKWESYSDEGILFLREVAPLTNAIEYICAKENFLGLGYVLQHGVVYLDDYLDVSRRKELNTICSNYGYDGFDGFVSEVSDIDLSKCKYLEDGSLDIYDDYVIVDLLFLASLIVDNTVSSLAADMNGAATEESVKKLVKRYTGIDLVLGDEEEKADE